MDSPSPSTAPSSSSREYIAQWKDAVARYQQPSRLRASWQLVNTLGAYAAVWGIAYFFLQLGWSLWTLVPPAVVGGLLLTRLFIIFHDCGHGSFFKSKRANDFWGTLTGILTFTPYYHWRWEHSIHHATSGDLDRRGTGDIWTLTVNEYLASSWWGRFRYKVARNPVVLFLLAPLLVFLVKERIPSKGAKPRERRSVWLTTFAVVAMAAGLIALFGWAAWAIVQLTAVWVGASFGVWLFYVQHQFEDTYWESSEDWDYTAAGLQGSSFYKLPRVLQWFSGNIGYHHIHHLSARVPNYYLERCHNATPLFKAVKPLTLLSSLKTIHFRLWDEERGKLISFATLRRQQRAAAAGVAG